MRVSSDRNGKPPTYPTQEEGGFEWRWDDYVAVDNYRAASEAEQHTDR